MQGIIKKYKWVTENVVLFYFPLLPDVVMAGFFL